jgi:hypothetical protein
VARLNISLTNDMAKRITDEADKRGKTISSLITEATNQFIEMHERGLDIDEVEDLLMFTELMASARSVPVPFRLLDSILSLAVRDSREKTMKLFYESGKVFGSAIRSYARNIDTASKLVTRFKKRLPLDDFHVVGDSGRWEITISGAGYGKSSSECLAEGLRGVIEAYGMKISSIDVLEGLVKAIIE